MKRRPLPNFRNVRALIAHPSSDNATVLVGQLERLGLKVMCRWPVDRLVPEAFDVLFFDADRGHDGQFSWSPGDAPVPMIALMGTEAPGRIEWTLSQWPSAYLVKPLQPNGIFSALAIAFHEFEHRRRLEQKVEELSARIRARPAVLKAITLVQGFMGVESQEAFDLLRTEAMRLRVSIETLCERIASSGSLSPLADQLGGTFTNNIGRKEGRPDIRSGGK